jgi:hypothetical protein
MKGRVVGEARLGVRALWSGEIPTRRISLTCVGKVESHRCRRRYRGQAGWDFLVIGRLTVGWICPACRAALSEWAGGQGLPASVKPPGRRGTRHCELA